MYLIQGSICKALRQTNISSAEVGLELEARHLRDPFLSSSERLRRRRRASRI
ncbi:hypothetical protein DsansV1_C25g0185631 [Dioscorea sansibarensis]